MCAFHSIKRDGDGLVSVNDRRVLCRTVKYNYSWSCPEVAAAVPHMGIQGAPAFGGAVRMIAEEDLAAMLTICQNTQELIPEGAGIFHHTRKTWPNYSRIKGKQ